MFSQRRFDPVKDHREWRSPKSSSVWASQTQELWLSQQCFSNLCRQLIRLLTLSRSKSSNGSIAVLMHRISLLFPERMNLKYWICCLICRHWTSASRSGWWVHGDIDLYIETFIKAKPLKEVWETGTTKNSKESQLKSFD